MTSLINQGRFFWRKSRTILSITFFCIGAAVFLGGCSYFTDYMRQPVIIDASQRNPAPSASDQYRASQTNQMSQNNYVPTIANPNTPAMTIGQTYIYNPSHPLANPQGLVRLDRSQYPSQVSASPPADASANYNTGQNQPNYNNSYPTSTSITNPYTNTYNSSPSAGPGPVVTSVTVSEAAAVEPPAIPSSLPPADTLKTSYSSNTSTEITNSASQATQPSSLSAQNLAHRELMPSANLTDTPSAPVQPLIQNSPRVFTAGPQFNTNAASNLAQPAVNQNLQLSAPPAFSIDTYIQQLERFASQNPDDINVQLALRFLYSAQGKDENALKPLDCLPLDKQTQTLSIARAALLAAQAKSSSQNDPILANHALDALQDLTDQIAEKADFTISCLKICNKVNNFGSYETVPPSELQTGRPRRALVYCELQNFQSELNGEGQYLTHLFADIALYDSSYRVIAQRRADVADKPTYNKRRDFFLQGDLDLPALAPGKYEIRVKFEDKIAQKITPAKSFEFEVNPPASP